MSRFSGWNEAALKKIGGISQDSVPCERTKVPKRPSVQLSSGPVAIIQQAIEGNLFLKCEREYKFLHDRRFRFDLAIPKHMIAIEYEGGIFTNGAHTRGKHYTSDCKKYNLATMNGWKLLRYTTEDTKKNNWQLIVVEEVRKLINPSEDV